jgi:carbamoyl-phosphate synthase large subunit
MANNFRLTIAPMPPLNAELLAKAKSLGFSDRQIAHLTGQSEDEIRALRKKLGLVPSYRLVDTCAAEFEAYTPYYYSTYDRGDDEVRKTDTRKVMILGGGPNRIGQGIEFDYCCVHAAFALKEDSASRRSWSIRTRRPSRPITTRATSFFSSR